MLYLTEYASPLGMMTLVCNKDGLIRAWIEGQKYFASTLKEEPVKIKLGFSDKNCEMDGCESRKVSVHERKESGKGESEKKGYEVLVSSTRNRNLENEKIYNAEDDAVILNLKNTVEWLERYFNGEQPEIAELVLAPQGSEFRQIVWKNLCEIPYGKVVTYGELAKKVAVQMGRERMSAQAVGGAVGHNPISVIIPCHRVIGADGSLTGYAGGIEKKRMLLELEGVL